MVQQSVITKPLKKIALMRLSALGDIVLILPTVNAIKRAFPQAELTWIISESFYPLVAGLENVQFIIIKKPRSLGDYWRLYRQLKPYHFDVLLACQANLRVNLIYPLISAHLKIGFDKIRARDGQTWFTQQRISPQQNHLLESFMQFASVIGVTDTTVRWDLPLPQADEHWAQQQLAQKPGAWVAINPSASKPERNWLLERYIEMINLAHERWSVNIVLTGGPSDEECSAAEQICRHCHVDCLNLVGKTSLTQLASLLKYSKVLISPDTGPLHIATAVNTPVIGLYAVAPSALSGPYHSTHLTVDKYQLAIQQILGKDPHRLSWKTRVHSQDAMFLITVEEVLGKLTHVLA